MSSSRVPRPRTTSSTPRAKATPTPATPTTPSRPTRSLAATTPTLKTKASATRLKPAAARPKTPASPTNEKPPSPSSPSRNLSIKEQIALRRAEQLKKATSSKSTSMDISEDGSVFGSSAPAAEDDILGRLSIRDTVDRAKSTGTILLASRELTRIPSYLFESHLGLTPEPLKNSPPEVIEPEAPSKIKRSGNTTWYEQMDLASLKLWDNAIVEIQSELSLFGSLKVLDLHKNKLTKLPDSIFDLVLLTNLDVSENEIAELPNSLASLPSLSTLNVSHNKLTKIPFTVKVSSSSSRSTGDSFFSPTIERATVPLPALKVLHASHNQLRADSLDIDQIPRGLMDVDFSNNSLGQISTLLSKLSALEHLRTLRLVCCELNDSSFTPVSNLFKSLHLLDLGDNEDLSEEAVRRSLTKRDMVVGPSVSNLQGGFNVIIGKPGLVKEAWEIEAENRTRLRKGSATPESVFSIGGRSNASAKSPKQPKLPAAVPVATPPREPVKESWEVEAEQGLLTEGGKRRARAAAAAAAVAAEANPRAVSPVDVSQFSLSPNSNGPSLIQFYDGPHATLTLPQSQVQSRSHNRSFSLVSPAMTANASDFLVPPPTMPLPTILSQPFANNIKVLILSNRRMESSIILPSTGLTSPILPHLDELDLSNCNLTNPVPTSSDPNQSLTTTKEPLFDIIAALFPSLSTLDLSYNALTTLSGVATLMIPDAEKKRKGLTTLRLRGNRLSSLEPVEELASKWHGGGSVEGWRGEELDLRDNEIGRLPPLLGLVPFDVLLVEGNTFRVPHRRVWEKDGTKGLLKWLSDRI